MLKKLISAFLMPLPVCFAVMTAGLLLLWFSKRQRAARITLTAGFAVLVLLSYTGVADLFLVPLENDYQPLLVAGAPTTDDDSRARAARWIVVLGGGHEADRRLPPTSELTGSTLARLVEALRLKRQLPNAKIILSGGFGAPGPRHADVLADAALTLGARQEDLVLERRTLDTHDEARFIHEIVGGDPFIIVSSASHLPRAAALFRKQGMTPLPSPTDYAALDEPGVSLNSLFPTAGALSKLERATHEYLGTIWSKLRGQL